MFALKQINLDLVGLKVIWYSLANFSQLAIIHLKLYRDIYCASCECLGLCYIHSNVVQHLSITAPCKRIVKCRPCIVIIVFLRLNLVYKYDFTELK